MKNYKNDFPFFENVSDIYFDSAATSQKPKAVLDKLKEYYTSYCANTHRGSHDLGNRATREYEEARETTREFINAQQTEEIVFTKGTTEAINLIASSFVSQRFKTLILSRLEHHSNIVPWQLNGFKEGENLFIIPMNDDLSINLKAYKELLKEHPNSFVSVTHVSNAFGIINPVRELTYLAHKYDSTILVDGAQAIAHIDVDVKELNVDFYVFSAHKMFGPTGVGVLYGKYELLNQTKPYQGGGTMIDDVSFEKTTYLNPPHRFEAGTQNIAGVIGFKEAIKYINDIGYNEIVRHDMQLIRYANSELKKIDSLRLFTDSDNICGNISFNIDGIHHNDIGVLLDKQHITLRTGHHCALPAMKYLGVDGSVRVSFTIYNTIEEIDIFIKALIRAIGMLK
ncbi:cysteine desulfurase [Sulfurimonas sp.]|nr:cysteine desulfurase [Sulfurimonas sp.]